MFWRKRESMLEAGAKAPEFELRDAAGTQYSLTGLLKDGAVLLAFYKISCPVCQLTFPFLERLSASNTVRIFGISQDDGDATRAFEERFGITFPSLLDASKAGYPVSNGFGISSVPSIFLVEQDGTISQAFCGFSKRDLLALGKRMGVEPFKAGEKVPETKPG